MTGRQHGVRVRAPGKINLSLRVGPTRPDGYHALSTVFQAVSIAEEVVALPGEGLRLVVRNDEHGAVPTDASNLAIRAALALADHAEVPADVHLTVTKRVPVAGGMAGGSADAAATLVACDALWGTNLSRDELVEIGARLGADVPFCLLGQTAVGTGRGDELTPAMSKGEYHWALAVRNHGLSTPEVFATYDELGVRARWDAKREADIDLLLALRSGDPEAVGAALRNDLQHAAITLVPQLGEIIAVARRCGATGVVVSGSGPTVAALARNRHHALVIAAELTASGLVDAALTAVGPVPGARVVRGE